MAIWSHITSVRRPWTSTGGRKVVSRALVTAATHVLSASQSGWEEDGVPAALLLVTFATSGQSADLTPL
ncbi:hypothetical protein [Lapillicoccus sp.]|uniref:hypothetical protein n=1 Tax=Lapillicoccus sp. TaxID=1909287 RepID=UPI0032652BEF